MGLLIAKWVGGILLILLVALIALISTRPGEFRIVRSASMSAPPEAVFALLNDFHQWTKWSPWEGRDPNLQRTYGGADAGPGATYAWVGNKDVGEGRMTIKDSKPGGFVAIQLEFIKPMAATNDTLFTLKPAPQGCEVTWEMSGKNSFMGKAFSLMMDMDKMIGKDFEQGLASLNTAAQAGQ